MTRGIAALAVLALGLCFGAAVAEPDYAAALDAITHDIAALKTEFAQLAGFSPSGVGGHRGGDRLVIDYDYRTHPPPRIGGWAGAVPHPDDDGIWFFIHLYDETTAAQIDTQPAVWKPLCLGQKRITFLILEGKKTKPLAPRIETILRRHGAKPCG